VRAQSRVVQAAIAEDDFAVHGDLHGRGVGDDDVVAGGRRLDAPRLLGGNAGLLVFPVIYSFALQGAVSASTIGALFIALPSAFQSMGEVGRIVGVFFFFVLAVGALTSAISLLEVVTASAMDEFGMSRRRAAVSIGAAVTIIGIAPAMDTNTLGLMDKIAGEFLLLLGGFALSLLAGWKLRSEVREELLAGASPYWQRQVPRILGVLRWVVPSIVAIVLAFSLRETAAAVLAFFSG